ncbi:MAG TPA: chemotaxis protein CheW [Gemmatimonadales bacterium]|jgi:chemotaxis signal transduction protein|nr:chemotaxis protein CheW [Gemmatimonadales bacterium]
MTDGSLVPARLLVFRVGTLACAAEVDLVREILPRLPTTRIPGAPPVVAGLVNVRGTLITVVEGWRALGQVPPAPSAGPANPPSSADTDDAAAGSTIILEVGRGDEDTGTERGGGGRLVGFTVDEVLDMLSTGDGGSAMEDRATLPGVDPTLVRAVGRRQNGEVFILLDVAALLSPVLTT